MKARPVDNRQGRCNYESVCVNKGFEKDPRMLCVRCSRYIHSDRHKEEENPNNDFLDMSGVAQNGVILEARATMAKAFADDKDFRRSYVDNIACILMDSYMGATPPCFNDKHHLGFISPTTGEFEELSDHKGFRDEIASDILKHILETP